MAIEADPEQPEEVLRVVEQLLDDGEEGRPDPWWLAGLAESLQDDA